ncbi:prolyl endopeptidase [Chelonus insularis]|uniref:prolyl endopeptidase n=1 Tax=Chelonus insularis TaxID=460826 RepID=UPI00158E15C8|nr:prolyl endopeptidase [Chelonus insularis]
MFSYPEARRDESCVDVYHGVEIKDPYRWLEDPESEEVKAFVNAQNEITRPFLDSCSVSQDIHDRLKQLWDYPKYSCPERHGDKYYFYKNTGLQNQSVLYVQDTPHSEATVFLDPNTLSEDGSVAISNTQFSEDGLIFAYGLSSSGSDWSTIHFIDVKTGTEYPEVLEKIKYSTITWTHDNKGIFYGTYLEQKGVTDGSETLGARDQKLCYHRVGTTQAEDVLVVEFPEEPLWRIGAEVTDCGKYLLVTPMKDCRDNLIYFTKLESSEKITGKLSLTKVVEKFEADYDYITNVGSKMLFMTNRKAPNYRLVWINFDDYAESNWTNLIDEDSKRVLDWAVAVHTDKLVVCYIEDVKHILQLHCLNTGKLIRTFPLDLGTIVGFSGDIDYSEIFYQFTSFLTPGIIYTLDLAKNEEPQVLREIKVDNFDPSAYKMTQVFYSSKDGTRIPMFIVMGADAVLDGSMPALLYGYGGFNVSLQPTFGVSRLVFIQNLRGVFALANLRGGGEYGEKWHNNGRLFKKQNVFDDFHCAAEYLIEHGYTTAKKLTIHGGSNGGLLVAACINQRPELYGAAIAEVGVMDMLKFHKFTIGYAWISDYGSSDDKEHFKYLLKYSPLHNVKIPENNIQYPATLLLTADHDDRVVPLHTLKLIATLQYTLGKLPQQTNPLMARIETKAGHGRGKPTTKIIEEKRDILAFMVKTLNLKFYK